MGSAYSYLVAEEDLYSYDLLDEAYEREMIEKYEDKNSRRQTLQEEE